MKETADLSLRRVLNCLQHDWIRHFVFHNQDQLLYQSLLQNAHLFAQYSVQTSSDSPSPSPASAIADVNERGTMLFVCANTVGPFTTGFEIMHRQQTTSKLLLHDRYVTRVVRDDDLGILLTIAQLPDLPLIEVSYCALLSPRFREHAFLLFHADQFRHMIHSCPGRFDAAAAQRAMLYRFFASEWRASCATCNSTDSARNCGCALRLARKSSRFDLAREIANLSAHGGAYDGIANIASTFVGPHGAQRRLFKVCRTRSEVSVLMDDAQRVKLSQWALSSVGSRGALSVPRVRLGGDGAMCRLQRAVRDDDLFGPFGGAFGLDLAHAVGAVGAVGAVDDWLGWTRAGVGVLDDVAGMGAAHAMGTDGWGAVTLFEGEDEDEKLSISSLIDRALGGDDATEHYTKSAVHGTQVEEEGVAVAVNGAGGGLVGSMTEKNRRTRAVRIAPATQTGGGRSGRAEQEQVDARAVKAELRKARNRASAQRSNERKKLALQQLKLDLSSMSQREQQLRRREQQLRRDNVKLRAAVCALATH